MQVNPIGSFFGDAVYKYDVPRQGSLFAGHPGRIELKPGNNFEMALRDLEGFERIWVIFQFHENEGWRPTTRPPVPPKGRDRVGTFASRSPYRPNPIGLSCVRLLSAGYQTVYPDGGCLPGREGGLGRGTGGRLVGCRTVPKIRRTEPMDCRAERIRPGEFRQSPAFAREFLEGRI